MTVDTDALVSKIWERHRASIEAALDLLEQAALDPGEEEQAILQAHRLSGSLGCFGFPRGSELAREIEQRLRQGLREGVGELVEELRDTLQHRRQPAQPAGFDFPVRFGRVLVVDDDAALVEALVAEGQARSLQVVGSASLEQARAAMRQETPALIVLDLVFPEGDALGFLQEVADQHPDLPVLVMTSRDGMLDRVQVARVGGRGFLSKPLPPARVMEEAVRHLDRLQSQRFKILALDDDPAQLAWLEDTLGGPEMCVLSLADPLQVWTVLEVTAPDLLLLDLEMPGVNGLEILRVLRNDTRYASLPVLVMTAHDDNDVIQRVFEEGADDFVAKPFRVSELRARVGCRLERSRLLRSLSETDSLTGLANRRKFTQGIEHFLTLAKRQKQPLSLAILDVDHFKQINDRHGHHAGDRVLRRLGELLQHWFRGEDMVGRWGGEEFVVGMFGMSRVDGVHRMADLLEQTRLLQFFEGQDGPVSFSAGVAQYPPDGSDLGTLCRAADQALYQAKTAGRDRVLACRTPSVNIYSQTCAQDLVRTFQTRGFLTRTPTWDETWECDLAVVDAGDADHRALDSERTLVLQDNDIAALLRNVRRLMSG